MTRRQFIKRGALFVPFVFVPRLTRAVGFTLQDSAFVGNANRPAAAGCSTESQAEGDVAHFDGAVDWTAETWMAASFVAASSFTVCKAQLYLAKQGTPAAGTLQVLIYAHDGSVAPSTLIGTGSATVDRTGISGSQSFVEFTGISAAVTNGTTYWVIAKASALDTDTSNRIYWQEDTTSETGLVNRSNDGTVWTGPNSNRTWLFKLFS